MPAGIRAGLPVLLLAFTLGVAIAACNGTSTQPSPTQCSYALSGASFTFSATGGSASVTVTAGATCTWTARADASWITISAGATGTGPGTVAFAVGANAGTSARSAALTIADRSVAISQDGAAAPCTFEISPSAAVHTKDAGSGSFSVAAPAGCRWTALSSVAWLTIAPGSSEGTGNGTVSYQVSRNVDIGGRTAVIALADRAFAVTQSGDTGVCAYGVSPVDFSPCMRATQMTAVVTTQAGCPWTASATDGWITIASGQSATGSGTVVFGVTENWSAPRFGQVLVRWPTPTAGQNIRIAQAGCRYAVNPGSISVAAVGGSGTFSVFQESDPNTCGGPLQDACTWSAESSVTWITVTSPMPRAGDNPVSFTVGENTTGSARTGTIAVRDQIVRITQAGV